MSISHFKTTNPILSTCLSYSPVYAYLFLIHPLMYPSIYLYALFAKPVSQVYEPKKARSVLNFQFHFPWFLSSPYLLPLSLSDTIYASIILVTALNFLMIWYYPEPSIEISQSTS